MDVAERVCDCATPPDRMPSQLTEHMIGRPSRRAVTAVHSRCFPVRLYTQLVPTYPVGNSLSVPKHADHSTAYFTFTKQCDSQRHALQVPIKFTVS